MKSPPDTLLPERANASGLICSRFVSTKRSDRASVPPQGDHGSHDHQRQQKLPEQVRTDGSSPSTSVPHCEPLSRLSSMTYLAGMVSTNCRCTPIGTMADPSDVQVPLRFARSSQISRQYISSPRGQSPSSCAQRHLSNSVSLLRRLCRATVS